MIQLIYIFLFGILAGSIGSMVGIGGGFLMILFFTLVIKLPIRYAVALSLISIIASSSIATSFYLHEKMTNIRLAIVLETATCTGAILGAFIALIIPTSIIEGILGITLLYTGILLLLNPISHEVIIKPSKLSGEYYDGNNLVKYSVSRIKLGLFASLFAGMISGIVGIGGGIIKVPIMNLIMKIPIKAAAATSNFMVGLTASASAIVYFIKGMIDFQLAIPAVLGIIIGAMVGTHFLIYGKPLYLRRILGLILSLFSIIFILKALGVVIL